MQVLFGIMKKKKGNSSLELYINLQLLWNYEEQLHSMIPLDSSEIQQWMAQNNWKKKCSSINTDLNFRLNLQYEVCAMLARHTSATYTIPNILYVYIFVFYSHNTCYIYFPFEKWIYSALLWIHFSQRITRLFRNRRVCRYKWMNR